MEQYRVIHSSAMGVGQLFASPADKLILCPCPTSLSNNDWSLYPSKHNFQLLANQPTISDAYSSYY